MDNSNVTKLHLKDKNQKEETSLVSSLSPREIVSELDRFVVGQNKAKRAVAVALRNRWRRQALKGEMKNEVLPKNILMIGPTGVGKTEISRRLSKLAEAPFVKVEATRVYRGWICRTRCRANCSRFNRNSNFYGESKKKKRSFCSGSKAG